jgi:hypothetical protein
MAGMSELDLVRRMEAGARAVQESESRSWRVQDGAGWQDCTEALSILEEHGWIDYISLGDGRRAAYLKPAWIRHTPHRTDDKGSTSS